MEIYQLQSFLIVAEKASITHAADVLCLSQPAVSRHILALEREVGALLFDRTSKGLLLTAVGFILQRHARQIMSIVDECQQQISDISLGMNGQVVLAVGARHCISDWLPTFQERYPNISLTVFTRGTNDIVQLILDREVDIGLVVHPMDHPELEVIELYTEDVVLVAPPEHPFATRTVQFDELSGTPLVLWTRGSDFRSFVEKAFEHTGKSLLVKVELDNVEEIKRLVRAGIGITFLPESIVRNDISEGLLSTIYIDGLPRLTRETCAAYRKDRYLSAAARRLLELLLELYSKSIIA